MYLETMPFSESGLIKQLESEGFSKEDATFGVTNLGANWSEQAARHAKTYLETMPFSKKELITQLESEGYTKEQATYGVKQTGL